MSFTRRDNCSRCKGLKGGEPGNENIINGKVLCDYCHADDMEMEERLRGRFHKMMADTDLTAPHAKLGDLYELISLDDLEIGDIFSSTDIPFIIRAIV